ncbi:nucleoside triphosphate pyrophosphohydrolase family protein [Faecalibaculum rodentium]|uniref:nucleoside triphosphate pyrophosphohydrolase family protein n=1 Tax=Faecalibaculum rodentium TaxID=1702221 RepID=UPI0025B738FA|nr:nucleoside triphosphate pyrophosphohydrolase family protein [Faecalibaculum rodentium]
MTNTEFQYQSKRTYPCKAKPAMLKHAVLGLTSEAGEVAGIMQKVYQGHGNPLTDRSVKDHMVKELGDCLWMIAEACTALDVTIADVMDLNIRKLQDRYPDGFDPFLSLHRKPGDI